MLMQVFDSFSLTTLIISLTNSCAKVGYAENSPLISVQQLGSQKKKNGTTLP